MVASVSDLLLAAQAKYQRPKSQIAELNDIISGGFDTYNQAKNQRLDISRKMVENQMLEQQMKQKELDKQRYAQAEEAATRKAVSGLGMAIGVTPIEKLDTKLKESEEITLQDGGKFSRSYKTVTGDVKPEAFTPKDYLGQDGKMRIGKWSATGGLIQSPNDPVAESGRMTGDSASLAYQKEKDAAAAELKKKQLTVPMFELTGEVQPDEVEAKAARVAAGSFNSFQKGIGELKQIIQGEMGKGGTGASALTGPESGKINALVGALKIDYKNLAGLGVLSESDMGLLENVIYNPGSWGNLFTKEGTALSQLDQTLTHGRETFTSQMAAKGYRPSAEFLKMYPPADTAPGSTAPATGVTHRWNPATGKVEVVR